MRSTDFRKAIYDFKRGTVGNLSDLAVGTPDFLRLNNNIMFSPMRGTRLRPGSRALSDDTIPDQPHSLGKYLSTGGANKNFVSAATDIYEIGTLAYTGQSLPYAFGGGLLKFVQLNDVMFVSEHEGGLKPICYIGTSWEKVELQKPVAGGVAVGAAGTVDVGTHHYRVRNRYTNGSSESYPIGNVVPGVASIINLSLLPSAAPGGRADWLGWTLERTKANDPLGISGVYYRVATGTTALYPDNTADDLLWDAVTEGWYTGPQTFDGMVPYRQRLFGWSGTFAYPSWEIGSDAFTGIMNFDPLNALRVGSDDGDTIQAFTQQGARGIFFKKRSMHLLEGSDLDSFNVVDVPDSGGIAGPRACVTMRGSIVITYNSNGLFIMKGSRPDPFGWVEVGHYIATVNPARQGNVVLANIGNRYFVMSYSAGLSLYNNEALVFDFNTNTWCHFTNFYAEDLLYQEDGSFAGATAIAANGIDRAGVYQTYSMLDGIRDYRESDNTGGDAIPITAALPAFDAGNPDAWKELRRIELSLEGTATDYSVSILSNTGQAFAATLRSQGSGKDWCDDDPGTDLPDDLEWDVGDWGEDEQIEGTPIPIPSGMLGKRFSVTITALGAETTGIRGIVFDGRFRPERKMV